MDHERVQFDVLLSVEKDSAAHKTLLLRSFFRQFSAIPPEYYEYLKGGRSAEELFRAFPDEAATARARCLHLEMGPRTTKRVYGHIERALGNAKAWVLVGGPPCQAYSVVGRSRFARLGRSVLEDKDMQVLYREYLRILARYKPPLFVMENVKGLLSAKFAGTSTFKRIISDLSSPSVAVREAANGRKPRTRRGSEYKILSFTSPTTSPDHLRPEDYLIAAEDFGVPQKRHRVILLGIRSDPVVPGGVALYRSPAPTVGDVLADLPLVRSQLSQEKDDADAWTGAIRRVVRDFQPKDFDNDVLRKMLSAVKCLRSTAGIGGRWVAKTGGACLPQTGLTEWIIDPVMDFAVNHETRKHIPEDLLRYLFVSSYARVNHASPKLHSFPAELLPNHKNVADTLRHRHGYFTDRFPVQVEDQPATTVTCYICKDGHSFIHHDPTQCRSSTVREAARVQTARAGCRVVLINWIIDRDDCEALAAWARLGLVWIRGPQDGRR